MNLDQSLRSLSDRVVFPAEPDIAESVVRRLTAPPPLPWWRRPLVMAGAATAAAVILIVGLIPAAREQVASWLGIRGVTIETVLPTTPRPTVGAPLTTTSPTTDPSTTVTTSEPTPAVVQSGLGEGLALGVEIVSLTVEGEAGFRSFYPELGLPDREFVDQGGRAWLLYGARPGLPEMQVPGVGMIVTEFQADSSGIIKQIAAGVFDFVEFGDGLLGVWLPGPHDLVLPDADGSAVNGRSAGNTLLWEQGDLTMRIETALSLEEALAIAETFE